MAQCVEVRVSPRPVVSESKEPRPALSTMVTRAFEEFKSKIAEKAGCDDAAVLMLPNQTVQVYGLFCDKLSGDAEQIELASFKLNVMPGCSAIMVSSKERVTIPWRGKGLGKLMQEVRMNIAKLMGCSVLQCTTITDNVRQNALLEHLGWKAVDKFVNPATTHEVIVWTKGLT